MTEGRYDAIVAGAGAMGSAALPPRPAFVLFDPDEPAILQPKRGLVDLIVRQPS